MDLRVFANRHLIPRTLAAVLSVVVAEATAADQSSRQRLADQFVQMKHFLRGKLADDSLGRAGPIFFAKGVARQGLNFDLATPLPTPPSLNDLGVGLLPGELDFSCVMVEGLNLPNGMEIAKLEDLVHPEDLNFLR